jgi:hypothetical protein
LIGAHDLELRRVVYAHVVDHGRPPTVAEAAAGFGAEPDEIAAAYRRLHDAHAFVLFPESLEIWIANPFCFAPTPHRVACAGRTWTGTCAWDALGIPVALEEDARVDTACACCGAALQLEVSGGELKSGRDLLVHFVVPARHWWNDIGFT